MRADRLETQLQANLEKAYEHNEDECKRCMEKVEPKQSFLLEETEKRVRQETAKEILYNVGNHYSGAWLVELYKKYGFEVEE